MTTKGLSAQCPRENPETGELGIENPETGELETMNCETGKLGTENYETDILITGNNQVKDIKLGDLVQFGSDTSTIGTVVRVSSYTNYYNNHALLYSVAWHDHGHIWAYEAHHLLKL